MEERKASLEPPVLVQVETYRELNEDQDRYRLGPENVPQLVVPPIFRCEGQHQRKFLHGHDHLQQEANRPEVLLPLLEGQDQVEHQNPCAKVDQEHFH